MSKKRNLIVLGRTGVGKSTVVNHIFGHENVFPVSTSMEGVTRERRTSEEETERNQIKDVMKEVEYNIKIIDTVGVRDEVAKRSKEVVDEIRGYLSRKAPEGVNLFLFVMRKGVFSKEERKTFDCIIANFKHNVKQISALIITGCEGLSEEARNEEISAIRKGQKTKPLADFMGKDVHAVGFPDVKDVLPELKQLYEEGIQKDTEKIRMVVLGSGVKTLSEDKSGEESDCKTVIILASFICLGFILVGFALVGFENAKTYFSSGLDEAAENKTEEL